MKNNYKLKQIKQKTSWVKDIELLKLNFNFKVNVKTLDFSLKNGLNTNNKQNQPMYGRSFSGA